MSIKSAIPQPNGYDLALFEILNEEYLEKPLVPKPVERTPTGYSERAIRVLDRIRRYVQVEGRNVLELGCGQGWLTAILVSEGAARQATGIDIAKGEHWERHDHPDTTYHVGDLSREHLVSPESMDLVISAVVFEHVHRPLQMLAALHRCLRTDGEAWLYFNLYRGAKASHVYRDVHFPWPHLLFDDAVCMAYYEKHHNSRLRFSWVNKLTAATYAMLAKDAGFETTLIELNRTPIDVPFYKRFEDRLGRYPALDLETDFMTMVLRKTEQPAAVWTLDYLSRQNELEMALLDEASSTSP